MTRRMAQFGKPLDPASTQTPAAQGSQQLDMAGDGPLGDPLQLTGNDGPNISFFYVLWSNGVMRRKDQIGRNITTYMSTHDHTQRCHFQWQTVTEVGSWRPLHSLLRNHARDTTDTETGRYKDTATGVNTYVGWK